MEKSLARKDQAITILGSPEEAPRPAESIMPIRKPGTVTRRSAPMKGRTAVPPRRPGGQSSAGETVPEGFYRDLVWNLRNGVLAVTRDGLVAVMNEVAYRILGLSPRTTDIGRPFTQVLKDLPDVS